MPNWTFGDGDTIARASYGPSFELNGATCDDFWVAGSNDSGVTVTERTALGSSAFFRGLSILANTIAGLPLKSYKPDPDGVRVKVNSLMDDPCPLWYTPFEFMSAVMVHLVLHGNAYLLHIYDGSKLVALFPVHPSMVHPKWVDGSRVYTLTVSGQPVQDVTDQDMTHIMGMSLDGLRGASLITLLRNCIGTTLAADRAAGRMFKSGLMLGGVVSAPGISKEQGQQIKTGIQAAAAGASNAGELLVIPASLTLSPWTMSAEDAQFIESRQFQVEEVARMLGIPKVLFAADGASTWGSGIAELDKGLAKYTFRGWTVPIEQRLSLVVRPAAGFCEFDYHGLFAGTPDEEDAALASQVDSGLITINEARAVKNLPPVPGGDVIRLKGQSIEAPAPAPVAAPATGTLQLPATPTEGPS